MTPTTETAEDKWFKRLVLIAIALIFLYLFWSVLLAIAVVVIGVLIAARFGGPILRFVSSCGEYLRRNF